MSENICLFVRWLARLVSLVVVGGFLFLGIGVMLFAHATPTRPIEWLTLAICLGGMAGMILAWKWEIGGSVAALLSIGFFAILVPLPNAAPIVIALIPCLLFLMDSLIRRLTHVRTLPF